jgi:hypothetical protein
VKKTAILSLAERSATERRRVEVEPQKTHQGLLPDVLRGGSAARKGAFIGSEFSSIYFCFRDRVKNFHKLLLQLPRHK